MTLDFNIAQIIMQVIM